MTTFSAGIARIFPVNLATSLGCALLSWRLVELPFTALRRQLRPSVQSAI